MPATNQAVKPDYYRPGDPRYEQAQGQPLPPNEFEPDRQYAIDRQAESDREERIEAERRAKPHEPIKPIMHGEIAVEKVKKLREKLAALLSGKVEDTPDDVNPDREPVAETKPVLANVVIGELYDFGLAFDVFDPQSGAVIKVARPHRTDVGDEPIFLTPEAVAYSVIQARRHQAALQ